MIFHIFLDEWLKFKVFLYKVLKCHNENSLSSLSMVAFTREVIGKNSLEGKTKLVHYIMNSKQSFLKCVFVFRLCLDCVQYSITEAWISSVYSSIPQEKQFCRTRAEFLDAWRITVLIMKI